MLAIVVLSSVAMGGPAEEPKMYYTDTSHGRSLAKDPDVEWFGGRYLMYYSVNRGQDGWAVGIAQSQDLTHWTKAGEVLPAADYESKGLAAPAAIVRDGKLTTSSIRPTERPQRRDLSRGVRGRHPLHARRDEPGSFGRRATGLRPGHRRRRDRARGQAAAVLRHADPDMKIQKLVVASAPADSDSGGTSGPSCATSRSSSRNCPGETRCIEAPSVCEHGGRLFLFYAGGYNNEPQQIGCAVSDDGIAWTRLSQRPLLPNGEQGEWNASESGHPGVFADRDGRTYLFFQGNDDKGASWHLSMMEIAWDQTSNPYLIRPGDGRAFRLQ
jgi:hypothetical protein